MFDWDSVEINEKHCHEPGLEQDTKLIEKYFYISSDIFGNFKKEIQKEESWSILL